MTRMGIPPNRQREPAPVDEVAPEPSHGLDLRAELRDAHPVLAMTAMRAAEIVLSLNVESNLDALTHTSPALKGFDWSNYIKLSEARVVRALACLERRHVSGRVLDVGSYFGNFSLALASGGYHVTALDSYGAYSPSLDRHVAAMRDAGISVEDTAVIGKDDLAGFEGASFDAVLCMGVIEHVPHTPRMLLAAIDRILKPGGFLVIDTPNLAYEYQRHKLMAGQSVFAPIEAQFETAVPFEGHHREYTSSEIRWMMERIDYREIEIEMYNYSIYGLPELRGIDLARYRAMEGDPERRELIFASARKPRI